MTSDGDENAIAENISSGGEGGQEGGGGGEATTA